MKTPVNPSGKSSLSKTISLEDRTDCRNLA